MHLNPTQVAIEVFGNARRLSDAIGAGVAAPFNWLGPRKGRSEPGDIPVPRIRQILDAAKARSLPLTADDLIYGREVPEPTPAAAAV